MAPERRREHLLDAALSVIVEHGYAGVSVEAVARAAGVTRPVIYDHFPNLGQLVYALIEREERCALDQLQAVVPDQPDTDDPVGLLGGGVARFLQAVVERPATWRIILLPPEGTPSLVRRHIESNRARTLDRIEQVVRSALVRAGLQDRLDTELIARAIRDLCEEAGRMVLTDPERYPPSRYERFVQSVLKLFAVQAR
jgi:AcrR family transcriptional regulator